MQTAAERGLAGADVQTASLGVMVQVWKGSPEAGGSVDCAGVKICASCYRNSRNQ